MAPKVPSRRSVGYATAAPRLFGQFQKGNSANFCFIGFSEVAPGLAILHT